MLPPLLMSVFMAWRLHVLKKHDRVLYKFCETRRQLMGLMREQNYNLGRQDYLALKQLSIWTDYAIHYYNDGKRSMFNARRVMEEIKTLKQVDKRIKRRVIRDPEVGKLYRQFINALFSGFLAFTPFFRSELVLRLLPVIAQLLARMGLVYFKKNAARIADSVSWFSEERRTLSHS